MGKKTKKFIDKRNAVTFHLVHRSQHDPLVTDETAPQHVLVEVNNSNTNSENQVESRKLEQIKYGITFDDDYDYLQHLKKPEQDVVWEFVENPNQIRKSVGANQNAIPRLQLPSSVFASEFEEEEGMLNKAAPRPGPRPDLDPDIVAALDDDFDFNDEENILEDDFILKAMKGIEEEKDEQEFEEYYSGEENEDDIESNFGEYHEELRDWVGPIQPMKMFSNEETQSHFTEYSMSSSVNPRNKHLTLLDDRFEKFFATYDEPELGDLSMEDIEGTWGQKHPYVLDCFRLYKRSNAIEDYNKEWDKKRIEKYQYISESGDDSEEEFIEMEVEDPSKKKWDCESVISTYSNIHNHPKLIAEPKSKPQNKIEIDTKTGLPRNVLRGNDDKQLTVKALTKLENCFEHQRNTKTFDEKSILSTLSVLSIRPKDETPDEKKERKRLLKDYRQMRRVERKANSTAFKEEKKRQTHIKINNQNIQGNKIF